MTQPPRLNEEIDRQNLNKPMSQLACPYCEATGVAWRDREWNEHPGTFTCGACGKDYYA